MNKNFKEYMDLLIQQRLVNETKDNLNHNISFFGFVGNLIDLYIPKVGNVFTSMGSELKKNENIENDK